MIRPLLISCGSRGDVEPFAALATGLVALDSVEEVGIMVPKMYLHLAPKSPKITVIPTDFTIPEAQFPGNVDFDDAGNPPDPSEFMRDHILPQTSALLEAARKFEATVVVTLFFTLVASDMIREVLRIPHITLHLQPGLRTAYHPAVMDGKDAPAGARAIRRIQQGATDADRVEDYLTTHTFPLSISVKLCVDDINALRVQHRLEPTTLEHYTDLFNGTLPGTHVMVATPSLLTPLPPDASPRAHVVGAYAAAYMPPGYDPAVAQAELAAFLDAGPKPAVVTYGSMGAGFKGGAVTRTVLRGLRAAGVDRVVLVPGMAKIGVDALEALNDPADAQLLEWARDRVFTTRGNVQYAWLFPRCALVLCHCGAGTTHAAFEAGLPVLGTPVFADQPFYVELLAAMGIGARLGKMGLGSITEQGVTDGVQKLRDIDAFEIARDLGERQRALGEDIHKACEVVTKIASEGGAQ